MGACFYPFRPFYLAYSERSFYQTECRITPIVFRTIMFRSGCSSIRTPPALLHLAAAAIPCRAFHPAPCPHPTARCAPSPSCPLCLATRRAPSLAVSRCCRGASTIVVPHQEGRGRRNARPRQGDIALKAYVANVCFKCFRCICCKCFVWMLQK
jgi:hypothetical protein